MKLALHTIQGYINLVKHENIAVNGERYSLLVARNNHDNIVIVNTKSLEELSMRLATSKSVSDHLQKIVRSMINTMREIIE